MIVNDFASSQVRRYDAVSLSICFLKKSTPELIPLFRLGEHQLVVNGRDSIINNNIHPVTITPELY